MLTFVPINLYGENVKKLFCQEGKKDLLLKLTMYHNMVKVAKPFCHNKKNCLQVCVWGGVGGCQFFSQENLRPSIKGIFTFVQMVMHS